MNKKTAFTYLSQYPFIILWDHVLADHLNVEPSEQVLFMTPKQHPLDNLMKYQLHILSYNCDQGMGINSVEPAHVRRAYQLDENA